VPNLDVYTTPPSPSPLARPQDEMLCAKGSAGPLCGTCITGYIYKTVTRMCEECSEAEGRTYLIVGLMAACAACVAVVLYGWLCVCTHNLALSPSRFHT